MRPVHLMIKPVSGQCNLCCKYCFYADEMQCRSIKSYGKMSAEVSEILIEKTLSEASECSFTFQGGEPTLIGLDFYKQFAAVVQKKNTRRIPVFYSVQTNGILLDDEWAAFFAENNFLIGLSLDGLKHTHDLWRVDPLGNGTYDRVIDALAILQAHQVEFNILTVITAQTAGSIEDIYTAYKERKLIYQQYIPCLDSLDCAHGRSGYSLTPSLYADFLKKLFDCWYADWKQGRFVYNRTFQNYIMLLRGFPPESCGMTGYCSRQLVVEADGSVFPCDFYALDQYYLGNICTDSFEMLEQNRDRLGFIHQSMEHPEECIHCEWWYLCRNGCRRDREPITDKCKPKNHYCSAYKQFFPYAFPRLLEVSESF